MAFLFGSIVPYGSFTNYTPALPQEYWDVYSAEQRVKYLFCEIDKVTQYLDTMVDTVNESQRETERTLADNLATVRKELGALRTDLTAMIQALAVGQLQWDVQVGDHVGTVQAQRDMFNDLTVHAITVGTLNALDMTVASLAECGLNVRGLAVYSGALVDGFVPEGIHGEGGATAGRLTVDGLRNAVVDSEFYVKTKE